jgi:class 3 adenylate cyclase/Cdc6-like AAA superfamily ATPase
VTAGRTLTVLVADLVDSTRLATSLGPERSDDVRRSVFSRFQNAAEQFGGTLIKTMGDGCLITYNSASDGIAAGVSLAETIGRLGRQVPGLRVRVGVSVGDLVEEDGDVFGEAVVLARRVCDAATPGQVLVTDLVRMLSGGRGNFAWQRVGDLFLKGIDEPVACSAARPPTDTEPNSNLPRALRRRSGELFVGRTDQLDALVRCWKDAESGERRVVFVSGEPGIGKTRLVAAAARQADEDGALVLFGRCEEDLAMPYQPFVDALRPAIDTAPKDLIAAHVEAHGGELRRLFPKLIAPAPIEASPETEQGRVTAALADMLARLARDQPLVLVLDDMHWAAPTTVQALRHLTSLDEPAPLLVLATFRETDVSTTDPLSGLLAEIPRHEHAQRLVLDGLTQDELGELIEAVSDEPLSEGGAQLAAAVYARTGGNPFFANQLLRHLAETGAVAFRDGQWQPTAELTDLPTGVVDVVNRRLARLSPETNELLAVASVAGERFTHALIGRAAHVSNIDAALSEALSARLLIDDGRGGYRFGHAIARDAVLSNQSAAKRAAYHRDILATLRSIYGDGPSAPLHDLAFHACGAAALGLTAEAARFSLAAAEAAVHRADVHAAKAVLNRCWQTLDGFDTIDHEARYDVCARLAEIHYQTLDGDFGALEAAEASARVLRSAERLIRLSRWAYRWDIGIDNPFALRLVEEGLSLLPPGPSPLRALGLATSAWFINMSAHGDPRERIAQAFEMIDELGGPGAGPDLHAAFEHAVMSTLGQAGVRGVLERIEATEGSPHSPRNIFQSSDYLGAKAEAYMRTGDREASLAVTRTMEAIAGTSGDPNMEGWVLSARAIWALLEARYDDALAAMQEAMDRVGVKVPNTFQVVAAVQGWVTYERGRADLVIPTSRLMSGAAPDLPGLRAMLAAYLCQADMLDDARAELKTLIDLLPTMAHTVTFASTIALMAIAVVETDSVEYAPALLAELEPFGGEVIGLSANFMIGAADRFIGSLRALVGDHTGAVAALNAAVALEEKLGGAAWLLRTREHLERLSAN